MTNIWTDSCDAYASSADLGTSGWTATSVGISAGTGRFSTRELNCTANPAISRAVTSAATGIVGFVMRSGTVTQTAALWTGREGATNHIDIRLTAGSLLTVTRNGTLLGTGTTVLFPDTHYTVQISYTINDATGAVLVKLNNVNEINVSGVDTRNGGTGVVDNYMWGRAGSGGNLFLSEIYINTTAGSAPNNGIWGDYRIEARRGSAAGNSAQFTPLASTNVSQIDDPGGNDGDTTYNASSTPGHIDLFQFGAVTPTGGTVPAIMHRIVARKDDAGTRTMRPKQRQSATNYNGTTVAMTTAYAHYTEVVETNPATAAAYTVAEMRATSPEFGYEEVA